MSTKTMSFGDVKLNILNSNSNCKKSSSDLKSVKESTSNSITKSSSNKSSNIWQLSNNELSVKKSDEIVQSIDQIQIQSGKSKNKIKNNDTDDINQRNISKSKSNNKTKKNSVINSQNYEKLVESLNMIKYRIFRSFFEGLYFQINRSRLFFSGSEGRLSIHNISQDINPHSIDQMDYSSCN